MDKTLRWKLQLQCHFQLSLNLVSDPKKELRPISLTSSLSKIAEDFIVSNYIKPAFGYLADPNQFGAISGSTDLALISMVHRWLEATDGNGVYVQVFLFDYRKSFDVIDYNTLEEKLKQAEIPNSIVNWIIDFKFFWVLNSTRTVYPSGVKSPLACPKGSN